MAARDVPAQATQRKKLSSAALRAIWQSNPTPEVRDLLWEIYRLQDIARQAYGVLTLTRMWGIEKPFLARLNELDSPKEKRGVVMLTRDKWEDWLACRDPEVARTFLSLHPAELMGAEPAPPENTAPRKQKPPGSGDLF